MSRLSGRLVAMATLLALVLALSIPVQGHTAAQTGHASCEGSFGFDHGMKYDGNFAGRAWYHTMERFVNTNGDFSVVKHHYYGTPTGKIHSHTTGRVDCGEIGEQ